MDCLFCKIAKKELPSNILFENENIIAFLDIKPISKGHTLVVPKKHSLNLKDLQLEQGTQIMQAILEFAPKLIKAVGADGYNVGINNGKAAGQIIMHTHFHIIPRWDNDGMSSWPNHDISSDELKTLQQKIVNFLKE